MLTFFLGFKVFLCWDSKAWYFSFQSSFTSKSIFFVYFKLLKLQYFWFNSCSKEQNRCSLQNKSFFKENLCLQCVVTYTKTAYRIGNQALTPLVVLKCVFFCWWSENTIKQYSMAEQIISQLAIWNITVKINYPNKHVLVACNNSQLGKHSWISCSSYWINLTRSLNCKSFISVMSGPRADRAYCVVFHETKSDYSYDNIYWTFKYITKYFV